MPIIPDSFTFTTYFSIKVFNSINKMKIITCILVSFLINFCACEPHKCKNCVQGKSDLPLGQLRQLRYEYLKNQILKKLHLTEPPKPHLPKPPLKSLLVIAEMAENETSQETDGQTKTESVIIYPKEENLTCSEHVTHHCRRYEFTVPESVSLHNILYGEVWFYNINAKVIQVISDPLSNVTGNVELDTILIEKNNKYWTKCSVPVHSFKSNVTSEIMIVIEAIEEKNEIDAGISYGSLKEEPPFLAIRSEVTELMRRRRSATCVEASTSCCKENFFLNFSEIGWDNWILHPDGYQANFCRGRCFNDLSNTRFYHSTVLLSYIRDNKDIAEEIGLNMCCTPSVMAPVAIIYRNEEELIYHKSIENMKVEACDCA